MATEPTELTEIALLETNQEYREALLSAYISSSLASRIEELRVARKVTKVELAKRLGTTTARIWAMEHGHVRFTVRTLLRVAAALKVGLEIRLTEPAESPVFRTRGNE